MGPPTQLPNHYGRLNFFENHLGIHEPCDIDLELYVLLTYISYTTDPESALAGSRGSSALIDSVIDIKEREWCYSQMLITSDAGAPTGTLCHGKFFYLLVSKHTSNSCDSFSPSLFQCPWNFSFSFFSFTTTRKLSGYSSVRPFLIRMENLTVLSMMVVIVC